MTIPVPTLIMAPMRGITTMHYRNAFSRHFQGLDIAMAPFIPTVRADRINPRLLKDVIPENNSGIPLIPQLIGNNAADFVQMAVALHDMGYDEVNWNLGCPHKPVRRKQRGSGLLPHPDLVDAFLDHACDNSPCRISIKVRLGVADKSELMNLIPVLNKHSLSEVIVHPRTAEQMYGGVVNLHAFDEARKALKHPVCYNGDITDLASYQKISDRFPEIIRFMLGRGLLANPFLCEEIKHGGTPSPASTDSEDAVPPENDALQRILAFHEDVLSRYTAVLHGDRPVLGKMKEFWTYQSCHLSNGHRMLKKIQRTQHLSTYREIVGDFLALAEWTV